MHPPSRPTWTDLAPILRGATPRSEDVWRVITGHPDFSSGAVRMVLRGARDVLDRHDGNLDLVAREVHQWAAERLVRRVLAPPPGLPVSQRHDGSPGDAATWLMKVWGNLARDWCKAERRRWARERTLDEARPPEVTTPEPPDRWTDDMLRRLDTLLARPERSGVSDVHVLVYLLQVRPDRVDRAMVDRACRFTPSAGSRSGAAGVVRPPDEVWSALQAWIAEHEDAPRTPAARLGLAWVLRSDDDTSPAAWRAATPAEARTATVTVGKWAIRCADTLQLPRAG